MDTVKRLIKAIQPFISNLDGFDKGYMTCMIERLEADDLEEVSDYQEGKLQEINDKIVVMLRDRRVANPIPAKDSIRTPTTYSKPLLDVPPLPHEDDDYD